MTPVLEPPSGNNHAEASSAPEVPEEIIARLQTENAAQKETIATLLAANAALMVRVVELERRLGLNSSKRLSDRRRLKCKIRFRCHHGADHLLYSVDGRGQQDGDEP